MCALAAAKPGEMTKKKDGIHHFHLYCNRCADTITPRIFQIIILSWKFRRNIFQVTVKNRRFIIPS